ncbi:GNAT family N-acetyltransferase [Isoptericola sp. BMS4]|uniref:GNAT family N-acetyltransferase n=1 Tax=Isoptericola sp. BMS4 TaxID=2527875 RepID=UPI0014212594|nr:GNAT family N-acetyltransferase [Isoptericola sp. BMS4]
MEPRDATPDDVPSLYALWERAFDAPLMVPVYETDAGRLARTVVAADAAGDVVASVYWTPRSVASADGSRVLRAGCVANVAVAPEARGRGLVRRLLAATHDRMSAAGVDVSLLFTGTPGVYGSSGYAAFDVPVLTGTPRLPPAGPVVMASENPLDAPADGPPTVRADRLPSDSWQPWGPALPWESLARLHDATDTTPDGRRRPLATIRTAAHWERRVPLWYRSCELLTARSPHGDVLGYVVLEPVAALLRVRELATRTGAQGGEAAAALADATLARARHHGATSLEVRLPRDTLGRGFADAVLADAAPSTDATGMLRPVHADPAEVAALRASPTGAAAGFHWPGDYA